MKGDSVGKPAMQFACIFYDNFLFFFVWHFAGVQFLKMIS